MNRILLMWKPSRDFQLVGLDNDHILVKFRNKVDFDKVFIKGLWKAFVEEQSIKDDSGDMITGKQDLANQFEQFLFGPWMQGSRFKFLEDKENEALFEENFVLIGEAIEMVEGKRIAKDFDFSFVVKTKKIRLV
ncbi:hypothetical protein Gotri_014746 [Gossypium trilobum]|uniref:DUF4283 domain-containing protein n=1 Tax=Gossypium trilobum TaxID=34281 RepID=A0A7J9DXU1_9ROSI|nr:hypothetical protein [Gossypium trilobum]